MQTVNESNHQGDVKWKKSATNKQVTATPTQKKVTGMAMPFKPANWASGKVPGKYAQKATVEDFWDLDDSEDDLTLENQAADGSVNNSDPEIISIDDNKAEEETHQEAADESTEAELGRRHIFVSNWTDHKSIRTFIERLDLTYLCLFQKRTLGGV